MTYALSILNEKVTSQKAKRVKEKSGNWKERRKKKRLGKLRIDAASLK